MIKLKIIFIGATLLLVSCLKDKTIEPFVATGPCVDTVSYANEIVPQIINFSCNVAGCHNSSANAGGYILENHSQVSANADIVFNVLKHNAGFTPMPLGATKLSDSLIQKFDCWIQQGKLDN